MSLINRLLIIPFFVCIINIVTAQNDLHNVIKGYYLGQYPPGNIPKVFAPGFISTEEHEFSCTFSSDMKEFYFNRNKDIWYTVKTDSGWTLPQLAVFNSKFLDNEPYITKDNQYLFFGSKRPHEKNNFSSTYGMWAVKRTEDGWTKPFYMGSAAYISETKNGWFYTRDITDNYRAGEIVKTRFKNDVFIKYISQKGGVIETTHDHLQGMHPCIAQDGSYIIFDAMFKEWGNMPELFISKRIGKNNWSKPVNLSDLFNMKGTITPYVSPDNRFLFFYYNHDIYWVSLNAINDLLINLNN